MRVRIEEKRFVSFFFCMSFFFFVFFISLLLPAVFVAAVAAAPIIVNPNSVLWPPVSSPFFYPPVSAKRSNTWPWLGVAPSHDAAPPPVLKSC